MLLLQITHSYKNYNDANELNTSLIEAVKEKLPLKENLANLLIDTLYIGKEAIYRRLRGEVPFTLEEAALISRKLGVSLDNVIGVCFSSNAVFDLNVVDHEDPFETYYSLLKSMSMCYMLCKTILPLPWVLLPILSPKHFL